MPNLLVVAPKNRREALDLLNRVYDHLFSEGIRDPQGRGINDNASFWPRIDVTRCYQLVRDGGQEEAVRNADAEAENEGVV